MSGNETETDLLLLTRQQNKYFLLVEQREDAGVLVIVESWCVGATAGRTLDTTVAATGAAV